MMLLLLPARADKGEVAGVAGGEGKGEVVEAGRRHADVQDLPGRWVAVKASGR